MSAPVGNLVPGTISPERSVPASIARPEYVGKKAPKKHSGSDVQSAETIEKMRIAGRIAVSREVFAAGRDARRLQPAYHGTPERGGEIRSLGQRAIEHRANHRTPSMR